MAHQETAEEDLLLTVLGYHLLELVKTSPVLIGSVAEAVEALAVEHLDKVEMVVEVKAVKLLRLLAVALDFNLPAVAVAEDMALRLAQVVQDSLLLDTQHKEKANESSKRSR
jgi:hypothetical protein